jgi:hypothetical protein
MRPTRDRAAVLLLTGVLLSSLAGCRQPSEPVSADGPKAPGGLKAMPAALARAPADDGPAKDAKKEDGFRFADDKGGQLLAKMLPPSDPGRPTDGVSGPKRLSGSPSLDQPPLPLPPNQGQVPRLPAGRKGPPLRPGPLPDELPLVGLRPEPPQESQLVAGDRVRLPGPDVNQPVPLPVLAAPAPDRTSLDDPTADFSAAAVQAAAMPVRQGPAPFVKLGLPDPFENRGAVRLREAPPEKNEPMTAAPRPPR